jgi:DNA-binding CsgD family transcriptional regulator
LSPFVIRRIFEALAALTSGDAAQLLQLVAEAERLGGGDAFTGELLVELGRLIEADFVTYTEVDHVNRRSLVYLPRPGDEDDDTGEIDDESWELMAEHPVCRRWRWDGHFSALRISDVIAQREWRRTRFYTDCCKPWGIEYELKLRLASPPWHAKTFAFNRKAGRDFTERDRIVLELLTPHLTRLWHAARTRRLLDAALAALERTPETESHGVVLLGSGGAMEFASAPAHRLLSECFPPVEGGFLPAPVADWLDSSTAEPLVHTTDTDRVVVVSRVNGALFLEEKRRGVKLTSRELEVLRWVAHGKTNAEIAQLLWLAPSTVRKHLENVYAKLGVTTRTAAVARFLGLIDAEAS